MATISLNNSSLKKYLDLLRSFDLKSRKKILEGLNESVAQDKAPKPNDIESMFGAWEDNRDSDEIISDIKNTRVNSRDIDNF
ncbi:hypothetical protein AM493_19400 [Flavobacterium akiainvivens]|uniref:Uncharacterized protein n=1 Tax=Flavobacterium akiainvivens TaxID=1202724 RepID=A0A0M8MDK4_9FLAO|nr:hypothetical protein [Flavobacterium akiainvivens]KOS07975.1 hypothetical protein AM493_19400 [Flavobacterium akiainvivens]SFQ61457.1 hypothetical protein SAMN05444144_11025 [Flavobacterium akiainvivens]